MSKILSVPWQPKGDGVDAIAFVISPDLGVKGRMKPLPGLSRVEEEEEENEQLEDLAPGPNKSLIVQDLLQNNDSDRAPAGIVHKPPDVGENAPKKARIDPDDPATDLVNK